MTGVRALQLFEASLDLPDDARRGYITEAAGGDTVVLQECLALLQAHAASQGFLEPPPAAVPPRRLGSYRLLEVLGSGGMGVVYRAERDDGAFEQQVAVKLLPGWSATPELVRRAEAERRFLASLQHPNIARILDGGRTAEGQPFVVMEFVDGQPIDAFCRERGLDPRQRVALFMQVLEAVDAAHRALIIHRDLKPANVLVDRQGVVKLLDFGIAKSLDGRIPGEATRTGLAPLTPLYASPEQLAGEDLTTASDVYALGLLLHQLLTGRLPHEDSGDAPAQRAQRLRSHPPTRPSTRLDATALALSPRGLRTWRATLAGDLDRVLQQALHAEPQRRYPSVRALADELERWAQHRPVLARGGDRLYRLGKFLRRNRWPLLAGSAIVLALALGLALAALQAQRARAEASRASEANRFLLAMISQADPAVSGRIPSLLEALDRAVVELETRYLDQPALEADLRHAIGRAYLALDRLDEAETLLRRAESLRAAIGGAEHAEALGSLAALDWSRGHYQQAENGFRRAIAVHGPAPRQAAARAMAQNDLAALLNELGRYAEALSLLQDAMATSKAEDDFPLRNRAVLLGNLGYARHGLGNLDDADSAYAEARALLEALHGGPHPDVAVNLGNHALVLGELGRRDEALALLRRSVGLRAEIHGPGHPMSVMGRTNYAAQLGASGRHEETAAVMAEALAHAPGAFDASNQVLGHVYLIAGELALARGDHAEALRLAEESLAVYQRAEAVEPGRRERAEALREAATRAAP